jgi:flagellar M-ring protein FliF
VNYEVSETTREILRQPGAIKRLSVAVLVDGIRGEDPETGDPTWTARGEEELQSLLELVSSTVGFDAERGDTITLKTMEFQPIDSVIPENSASLFQTLNIDATSLIQLAVLAIVALSLGLFVIRPILASRGSEALPALAAPDEPGGDFPSEMNFNSNFDPADFGTSDALTGEIDDGPGPLPGTSVFGEDGFSGGIDEDPVERLRNLIDERKDETIEVLRSWMENSDKERV